MVNFIEVTIGKTKQIISASHILRIEENESGSATLILIGNERYEIKEPSYTNLLDILEVDVS